MSAHINSLSRRGTQYSNCVCAGIIYLVFGFASGDLQARCLDKTLLSASPLQASPGRKITMFLKPLSTEAIKKPVNI